MDIPNFLDFDPDSIDVLEVFDDYFDDFEDEGIEAPRHGSTSSTETPPQWSTPESLHSYTSGRHISTSSQESANWSNLHQAQQSQAQQTQSQPRGARTAKSWRFYSEFNNEQEFDKWLAENKHQWSK